MSRRDLIPGALAIVALLIFSRVSPYFLDVKYLLSTTSLYAEAGLLALGMTFILVSGNIDLSVGSNMVLVGCLAAKMLAGGLPIPVVIVLTCVLGAVFGTVNGLLVAILKLPSFLVTLGTMATFRGLAQAMMGPSSLKLPPNFKGLDTNTVIGIPAPFLIFTFFAIVAGLVLHRTVFGRWVTAIGTNPDAAYYAGVPVARTQILVFAISGFMAGVGGLLLDSRLAIARHDLAKGIELEAITIAVVGGVSILGGRGSILGTGLALILIDILKTGMGVANIKAEFQLTLMGLLLIVAALSMNYAQLLESRFTKSRTKPATPVLKP